MSTDENPLAAPTPAKPVNERVAAALNQLMADAAAARSQDLAERLHSEADRWRSKEITVVVAGEPNRGKSTLINSLLGRPVLPSGNLQTTTTFAIIRQGEADRAVVHRIGAPPEELELTGVAEPLSATAEAIEGVTIELDHPLLAHGLVLVDTPGVGGLDGALGRVTLTVLGRADAMLFVLDPDEPLSKPELDFLAQAADRIERVLFVVSKIDRSVSWRTIAADDRALLERHAPRFSDAPIMAVSPKLKLMADELAAEGTPDNSLVAESAIPELGRQLLRTVVARAAAVRLANLLRLGQTVLDRLEGSAQSTLAASASKGAAAEEAERAQRAVDELRYTSERLGIDITDRFNALRDTANTDFSRIVRDLAGRLGGEGAKATGPSLLEEVRDELRAALAELGESLAANVNTTAEAAVGVLRPLGVDVPELSFAGIDAPEIGDVQPVAQDATDSVTRMRIASSVSSGGMALAMFGGRLGAEPLLLGFMGATAVLGLATAAINVRMMRRQRDAAAARKQVQEALEAARGEVAPAIRQHILAVQRELERSVRDAVRARTSELQSAAAEAARLARAEAGDRQRRHDEAQRALATYAERREHIRSLSDEVTALLAS